MNIMREALDGLKGYSRADTLREKYGLFDDDFHFEERHFKVPQEYVESFLEKYSLERKTDGDRCRCYKPDMDNVSDTYYMFGFNDGADDLYYYNLEEEDIMAICHYAGVKYRDDIEICVTNIEYYHCIEFEIRYDTFSKRHKNWMFMHTFTAKDKLK